MFPLPTQYRPGQWLNSVKAEFLRTVANVLNDITGVGISWKKPSSGMGWVTTVNVDGVTLEINRQTNTLNVKASGITATQIATSVAGNGLAGGGGTALSVNVDGSTLEISSDSLRIKDGGVTAAKIGSGAVTEAKIGTGAVTADKIGSSAVTTAKINANAVTSAKTSGYSGSVSPLTPVTINVTNGLITSVS